MLRPVSRFLLLACVTSAANASGSAVAAAAVSAGDLSFARPNQLVDIGGRRLNLYCSGSGPVTVVFDAPGTDAGWSWHGVQPRVAARTRACVYDRAGMGFSDPSPLPATSSNAVQDLHALLTKAGIKPPYILVGNSYGGANVQLYAYRYPEEVKALVLVEPGHEDETERLNAAAQGKLKQMYELQDQAMAHCAEAAQKGFAFGSETFVTCTGGLGDVYGRGLAAARMAIVTRPAYWRAAVAENSGYATSNAELKSARRSFGDLPLVILTRGISPYAIPGQPASTLNKAVEAENLAIHKEVAALSTRSSHHVVPGAGHVIQQDRPDAVADAIFEALERIRQ
ncbi:MAG TPA: alpha/beta hydrolase [Telluria sp.]